MATSKRSPNLMPRLVLGCLVPLVAGAIAHAAWTVTSQRRAMEQGLSAKTAALGGLLVDVVGPSMAFDDLGAVQDGLAFLEHDPDFAFAAAYDAQGQVLAQRGGAPAHLASPLDGPHVALSRAEGRALGSWPVSSGGRALGSVVVALRTAALDAQLASMARDSALISLATIALSVTVVLALASIIQRRNRDMRRVLDSVEEALFMVQPDGRVEGEPSAIAATWFHGVTTGEPLWQVFARLDARAGGWLEVAWRELEEGVMPFDVLVDQLPRTLTHDGHTYRVSWSPEREGERVRAWLVVVVDITGEVERARAEAQGRDLLQLVEAVSRDRAGTAATLLEADRLVSEVVEGASGPALLRALHTLKGVCAVSGLSSVATLAHELEDEGAQGPLEARHRGRLASTWMGLRERLGTLTGDSREPPLDVSREDLARLRHLVEPLAGHGEALEALDTLLHPPAERALARLGSQATRIAERLGRGPLTVAVEAHGVRLPGAWQPFWASLVHVVRNALDHGLEPRAERLAAGKPAQATLRLEAHEGPQGLRISVGDDGRGIDWAKVATAARARGLPADEPAALVDALFADGLSTREQVTELSGRGVGLAAVRDACRALGGDVSVDSVAGQGTTFHFRWPPRVAARRLRIVS